MNREKCVARGADFKELRYEEAPTLEKRKCWSAYKIGKDRNTEGPSNDIVSDRPRGLREGAVCFGLESFQSTLVGRRHSTGWVLRV